MGVLEVPAITESGESNWPARWPIELLEAKKAENPIAFSSQFMLKPVDLEHAPLKTEWLHYYLDEELPPLIHYIGIDPSPSGRMGTDRFGLAVVGIDHDRKGFLRSAYHLQIDPLEQVERIKLEAQLWRPQRILVEAIAAQSLFTKYMLNDVSPKPKGWNTRFPKIARYIAMIPAFSTQRIRVRGQIGEDGILGPADSVSDFFEEWRDHPSGHDDVLDAVQIAIEAAQLITGTPIMVMVHPANVPENRSSPRPALGVGSTRLRGTHSPFAGRRLRDSPGLRRRRR